MAEHAKKGASRLDPFNTVRARKAYSAYVVREQTEGRKPLTFDQFVEQIWLPKQGKK